MVFVCRFVLSAGAGGGQKGIWYPGSGALGSQELPKDMRAGKGTQVFWRVVGAVNSWASRQPWD